MGNPPINCRGAAFTEGDIIALYTTQGKSDAEL
jgi:hypothetical protein